MGEREEHDAFEDKKARFVTAYEAHWRFPGRGDAAEARQWWDLLATVRLSDIDVIVEAVAREWPKTSAPRRALFRGAIRQLLAARAEDLPPLEDCALCDNSGRMWGLGRLVKDRHGRNVVELSADPAPGPLGRYVVPCTCLRGQRYTTESDRVEQQRFLAWREGEFTDALLRCDTDYGLTTVGKFFAYDVLKKSYAELRKLNKREKADERPRVASAPKPVSSVSRAARVERGASHGRDGAVVAAEPKSATLPGGYTDDDVPF